jgi:hypothetical protein
MTIHALVSGSLFRSPEQRTSKTGKPFVTAAIKIRDGDATQWIRLMVFSDTAQSELPRTLAAISGLGWRARRSNLRALCAL